MKARPDVNDTLQQEGVEGVRARHDRARRFNGPETKAHDLRFRLVPFNAIKLSTAPNYLVKGVIPRTGLVVIWGPPKCGKSFFTFDIVMHIALGWKYIGRRVQQGPVVYLALEGGHGFRNRVEAWRRRHLDPIGYRDPIPFYLLDVAIDLVADRDMLIAAIKGQLGEARPAAVAIDTLNRALIGDENKSDDMAKFIRAADMIREAFGCSVIIVHHCGVAGSRPRGHTSLSGADDAQIAVERDKDGNITATVEHMKDGESGAAFTYKLEAMDLGNDADGDALTSCVIVPAEGIAGPKLSKINRLAFNALTRLIKTDGRKPPAEADLHANVRVCLAATWRDQFYAAHPSDKQGTKQRSFVRAHLDLVDARLVKVWDQYAWLAADEPDNPDRPDKKAS